MTTEERERLIRKPWYKSKTVLFGIALALISAVQQFLPELRDQITPEVYSRLVFVIGIAVAGLRAVTSVPLKK